MHTIAELWLKWKYIRYKYTVGMNMVVWIYGWAWNYFSRALYFSCVLKTTQINNYLLHEMIKMICVKINNVINTKGVCIKSNRWNYLHRWKFESVYSDFLSKNITKYTKHIMVSMSFRVYLEIIFH